MSEIKPRNPKPEQVAKGYRCQRRSGIRISCTFHDDTFAQVKARSVDRGISFAQSVRELLEAGFLYEEEN